MNDKPDAASDVSASAPRTSGLGWEEFSREVVDFFASIKLAMFLFIVLAMTATIGTVIQQGERPETDAVYADLRKLADGEGASE